MLCIHSHILLYIRAPVLAQVVLENYPYLVTLTICVLYLCPPFVSICVPICVPICVSPFVIHLLSPLFDTCLEWCADSGASSHMTPHRDWFVHYTPHTVPIKIADGNIIYSAGIGDVHFKLLDCKSDQAG